MHGHHRQTQIPKCTQTTSLPPSASSLRTELGSRGHPAGWMGLRQISMWHTSESRALPCDDRIHNRDATPSTPQSCQPGQSSWTARSRLGHRHLTGGGVPAGQAPAPVAQAPLSSCASISGHGRGPVRDCGTSLWSLALCGLTTLLVSSLSALPDFRFRNLMIKLPSPAENNVTGFAPSPTNHGISHVSKEESGRLPEHLPVVGEGGLTVLGLRKPSTRPTVTKQNHNCLKSALLQLQTPGICM